MFNCYAIFKIYVKRNNIFMSAIFRANVVNCTVIQQDSFLLMNPYFSWYTTSICHTNNNIS